VIHSLHCLKTCGARYEVSCQVLGSFFYIQVAETCCSGLQMCLTLERLQKQGARAATALLFLLGCSALHRLRHSALPHDLNISAINLVQRLLRAGQSWNCFRG
jgi:hypothetical protein